MTAFRTTRALTALLLGLLLSTAASAMDRPGPAPVDSGPSLQAAVPAPPPGSAVLGLAAPDFALFDLAGESRRLADLKGSTVVLEWINVDCPFVKNQYDSTGNLPAVQKDARAAGAVWLSICSSAPGKQGHYDAATLGQRLKANGWAGEACLVDGDGTVGRAYGAKTTPHLFVIDAAGLLVYDGAIDSVPGTSPESVAGAENYVRPIVAALAAGETVEPRRTKPYGCGVKY